MILLHMQQNFLIKQIIYYGHMLHPHCLVQKTILMQLSLHKKKTFDTLIGCNEIKEYMLIKINQLIIIIQKYFGLILKI